MQFTEQANKQILIVEDEGLIAADIQQRVERIGYSVPAIARSGEEALRRARSTPFDLVLMDIRLKGEMDGIATAQVFKTELETPVVYITAHADQDTIERAKLTEPFGYILKPIGDGDLRSTLQISLYKHEMEKRLRSSESWLSATLRNIGDGVVATNTKGEIVFMNPVAEQLTGWNGAEAIGLLLMEVLGLYDEFSNSPAKNPVLELLSEYHPVAPAQRVYRLISRGGAATVVELGCFENRWDQLLGSIVVLRDIGARREMEAHLVQAQRMEAIANMAGRLAHDFNNQLTVILGCAEELGSALEGDEKASALDIKHAASVASSITSQLLTLSRRQTMRPEILNINEVIAEMQPMISHVLGKGRLLTTELGSPAGLVRCDRNQLKQSLLNMALNSRDAMPVAGELRIETSVTQVEPDAPEARLCRPGAYVRLALADTGEGMDKGTLARIFEPFFTTKKAGLGTGLGLSIVHSIIAQVGGHVTATSEVGKGTRFEILLPRVSTFRTLNAQTEDDVSTRGEYVTPTVLLVDDEERVRRLMHRYFEEAGFQLLEASDAEEAESIASVYNEPIHILVTDVRMPGRSGPHLAERMKALRPEMKVLFVSGYPVDTLDSSGMLHQGLNFLPKPFTAEELLSRVQALLGMETHARR